ncbi:hypothetical protein GGR53DRAFT_524625 [Hypoxylon sp. FL1150]|nr:hypothetical protein GGR53DRAFT_524625 [Hypoxylon sp. FL1150]
MPLDVLGRTRVTLTEPASTSLVEIPGKRKSSTCVDYVPALCTHRPSRQRHLRAGKLSKLGHLEENSVNHRIFERILRPVVFYWACLFERHFNPYALVVGIPAELKHINKRRKRNQQGLP